MAVTKIADLIVPEVFTPYVQQLTEEKSRLIQSGALMRDPLLDQLLAGGGLTFNVPSFKDLANDAENVSSDDDTSSATPNKITTAKEIAVRLERNQSWSAMDLARALAGADPMAAIASRVADYWNRRLQAAFVATLMGIFADNDAAPAGTEHVQYDLTNDIKGASYTAGTTDFHAEAFLDAAVTLGDSMESLTMVMVHSLVYNRMLKNDLITFRPDSEGKMTIPTFLGRDVIVDDGLPNPAAASPATTSTGIFHTWLFGTGAIALGETTPPNAVETDREILAGNGGGQDILVTRKCWTLHPRGHAFVGTASGGGPTNAATTNNLAAAGSWQRVYPERKQIKIARLITREA